MSARLLARLFATAATALPLTAFAEGPTPDPYFGEALFHAYQGDFFGALERLDAELAQHYGVDERPLDSLYPQVDDAEFSVGEFELEYRMHLRAGRAIRAVLEGDVDEKVRNDAAYRLARIYFENGAQRVVRGGFYAWFGKELETAMDAIARKAIDYAVSLPLDTPRLLAQYARDFHIVDSTTSFSSAPPRTCSVSSCFFSASAAETTSAIDGVAAPSFCSVRSAEAPLLLWVCCCMSFLSGCANFDLPPSVSGGAINLVQRAEALGRREGSECSLDHTLEGETTH